MNYSKINNILGWLSFLIATLSYILTLEPTASFWDCGEFIAAAYKMQIVHQPGAPLFLMLQNLFSNFAMGRPELIAYWMNVGSAVSSGLTILFLFWTITALAKKVVTSKGVEITQAQLIQIMGAGLVGTLAYAFSDTFWFSAVESEVYAMASLCTAVVFWAILKWDSHADEPYSERWLILIAYVMGLSIGVHLLNLLTIPALALVVYFRKNQNPTSKGALKAMLIGVIILGLILWGIIQYSIKFAAYFDLFFVNTLGLGFGSGVFVFAVLLIGGLTYGIIYSIKHHKKTLNIVLLCTSFIFFGYSSFTMITIRAKANPTLNNNDPDNTFALLGYLNREQYGDDPLFNGPYFDSKPIEYVEGSAMYRKGDDQYVKIGNKPSYKYDRETLLPRIYSSTPDHISVYRSWLNLGENEQPQFSDNLKFLFSYQIGHMYARYFMWNFVGRQNDQQGQGNFTDGNWISGIKFIDQMRLGGQNALPDSQKDNPSRNTYFFLPLILGLLGAFWHFKRNQKDAGIVGLLFFFTGIAIVLYLNQSPLQPRERDYAFAGSFYAFAIWVGFGVLAISDFIKKKANHKTAAIAATAIGLLAAPVLMASQNWDDHNRSNKSTARDLAVDYLESCAPNAILFTYGDNDTYPLWYAQEVENIRPDVRVVNLSLLSADWYVRQMKEKVNEADALPISMKDNQFVQGTRDFIRYTDYKIPGNIELENILGILLSDNPQDQQQMQDGSRDNFLPTKNFKLTINKEDVIKNYVVPKAWQDQILDSIVWTYNKDYVSKAELSILDILANNNWERPIYFARTVPSDNYLGLDNYLITEGFAYRLMPILASTQEDPSQQSERINTEAMYDNTMNKFVWGNLKTEKYLDPESYGMLNLIMNNFNSLSNALVAEGKMAEAKEVMKRSLEVVPDKIYAMRETLQKQSMAESLYKVGDIENANRIVTNTTDYLEQNLNYFFTIAETKPNLEMNNMQLGMYILHAMDQLTAQYQQTKENERIKKIFADFEKRYEVSGLN